MGENGFEPFCQTKMSSSCGAETLPKIIPKETYSSNLPLLNLETAVGRGEVTTQSSSTYIWCLKKV